MSFSRLASTKGWELLESSSGSNVAEVVVNSLDTENFEYQFVFQDYTPATNSVNFLSQVSTDGGVSFIDISYVNRGAVIDNNTISNFDVVNSSYQISGSVVRDINTYGKFASFNLFFSKDNKRSYLFGSSHATGVQAVGLFFANLIGTSSALNAIRFFMSSGNIKFYRLSLYRRKM